MKTFVMINPASAGGRTAGRAPRIIEEIRRAFGPDCSFAVPAEPVAARRSLREATRSGYRRIIVAGGDGTLHETVNGLLDGDGRTHCELGLISSGTGHGFAQSLGLPDSFDHQIEIIRNGRLREVDAAIITYRGLDGTPQRRWFLNECQIGIGAAVVCALPAEWKRLGGLLAFGLSTLSVLARHPNQHMAIALDGAAPLVGKFTGVAIGNGTRTGGGMLLTPLAALDDGLLDVLLILGQTFRRRLLSFPKIYAGKQIRDRGFRYTKVRRLDITSEETVMVAADGELLGSLPCTIEVVPSVLRVRSGFQKWS